MRFFISFQRAFKPTWPSCAKSVGSCECILAWNLFIQDWWLQLLVVRWIDSGSPVRSHTSTPTSHAISLGKGNLWVILSMASSARRLLLPYWLQLLTHKHGIDRFVLAPVKSLTQWWHSRASNQIATFTWIIGLKGIRNLLGIHGVVSHEHVGAFGLGLADELLEACVFYWLDRRWLSLVVVCGRVVVVTCQERVRLLSVGLCLWELWLCCLLLHHHLLGTSNRVALVLQPISCITWRGHQIIILRPLLHLIYFKASNWLSLSHLLAIEQSIVV